VKFSGEMLVTDWGEYPAPPDLITLRKECPMELIGEGTLSERMIPLRNNKATKVYYDRLKQLCDAITTIESTGTLCVACRHGT